MRKTFSRASSVIATPGTWKRWRPNCLIVIPSLAMPYKALEPSMVAVFIDNTSPATRQKIMMLPSALPTRMSNACV